MTNKYIIDTKNGAGVMLVPNGGKSVSIRSCDEENGDDFEGAVYSHEALRILSAELLIAADKLEAGTLFEEGFDWDTVETGMAFNLNGYGYDCRVYYFLHEKCGHTFTMSDNARPQLVALDKLTRAPEHDIKKG